LNASRATSHSLQAEFDRIQDYLELMSIRMGPRLKFTLELPGTLAQAKVPSLLLQPLVENAIQHGLEPKVGGGEIRISARREGAWPELQVAAIVGDGESAVEQSLLLRPDVLFFDIRMPGQSGIDAAAQLADEWPAGEPFPALVFITAYDQYAVQAFETQAVDYVLKPVQPARLAKTVAKVKGALARRGAGCEATLTQLRSLLGKVPEAAPQPLLGVLQVSVGSNIR